MNSKYFRKYYEDGCLCILTNKIKKIEGGDDKLAVDFYEKNCHCSRHTNSAKRECWDLKEAFIKEINRRCSMKEIMIDLGVIKESISGEPDICLLFPEGVFHFYLIGICSDHYLETGLQSLFKKNGEDWLSLILKDSLKLRELIISITPASELSEITNLFSNFNFNETLILISFPEIKNI